MQFNGGPIPWNYRELLTKIGMLIGAVIIIYAVLWILAELKLIPVIIFALFPQVVYSYFIKPTSAGKLFKTSF